MRLIEILNKKMKNVSKKGEPHAASFVITSVTVYLKDCLVKIISDSNSCSTVKVGCSSPSTTTENPGTRPSEVKCGRGGMFMIRACRVKSTFQAAYHVDQWMLCALPTLLSSYMTREDVCLISLDILRARRPPLKQIFISAYEKI